MFLTQLKRIGAKTLCWKYVQDILRVIWSIADSYSSVNTTHNKHKSILLNKGFNCLYYNTSKSDENRHFLKILQTLYHLCKSGVMFTLSVNQFSGNMFKKNNLEFKSEWIWNFSCLDVRIRFTYCLVNGVDPCYTVLKKCTNNLAVYQFIKNNNIFLMNQWMKFRNLALNSSLGKYR